MIKIKDPDRVFPQEQTFRFVIEPKVVDLHGLELVRTIATPKVTHLKFARG